MARNVLKFEEPPAPVFTVRQVDFCDKLIGMGLTRLTIASLILNKDAERLNYSEVSGCYRLIDRRRDKLGFGVAMARKCGSPWMVHAVREAARDTRIRVRVG
jgi:hypothetical protein